MAPVGVDAARTRIAGKRGGGAVRVEINESLDGAPLDSDQMVRLDDALDALAKFDARKAKVVELRFFAGLSVEETAAVLKISQRACCATGSWRARGWRARCCEEVR
jgi:DNA-directed RNA polymerase specialized sigma24 family protein